MFDNTFSHVQNWFHSYPCKELLSHSISSKQKIANKQKRICFWYCKPNQKTIIGKLIVSGRKDF